MSTCEKCPNPSYCNSSQAIKPCWLSTAKTVVTESDRGAGLKYDGGKPRWGLMTEGLPKFLQGVVDVLTFGAKKYQAHSWKEVEDGYNRYRDAMYRHLNAIERGETHDPESGLPHWDHVATNVSFCRELDDRL